MGIFDERTDKRAVIHEIGQDFCRCCRWLISTSESAC